MYVFIHFLNLSLYLFDLGLPNQIKHVEIGEVADQQKHGKI